MDVDDDAYEEKSKRKVQLKFTQTKLQAALVETPPPPRVYEDGSSPPTSTDHFLTIVPKPTLLGKQQAKKRLQAFGAFKACVASPKKVAAPPKITVVEVSSERFTEHGVKVEEMTVLKKPARKGENHVDRAKGTMEEIEVLKKRDVALLEAAVINNRCLRSRSPKAFEHSRYRDRRRKHSESNSKHSSHRRESYPKSWREMRDRKLNWENVKQMEEPKDKYSKTKQLVDWSHMFRFKTPAQPLHSLRYKPIGGGQEQSVPAQYIRYTQSSPKLPYSVNISRNKHVFFEKKLIMETISKDQRESINRIVTDLREKVSIPLPKSPHSVRKWYPKRALITSDELSAMEVVQIVEPSPLKPEVKTVKDPEKIEEIAEEKAAMKVAEKTKESTVIAPSEFKLKKKHKKKHVVTKSTKKSKKMKRKKKRKKKKRSSSSSSSSDTSEDDEDLKTTNDSITPEWMNNGDEQAGFTPQKILTPSPPYGQNHSKSSWREQRSSGETHKTTNKTHDKTVFENYFELKNNEVSAGDTESTSTGSKINEFLDLKGVKRTHSPSPETVVKKRANSPKVEARSITPDTDEYHSHWESEDEEAAAQKTARKITWESDEEYFNKTAIDFDKQTGRSLEMPLNISLPCVGRVDLKPAPVVKLVETFQINEDSWERGEYKCTEMTELENARRTLSEERRQLDLEKERVAEMERKITTENVAKERKSRKSRWESVPEVVDVQDIPVPPTTETSATLENEYEEFIKAVASNTPEPTNSSSSNKSSRSSSSSSSSISTPAPVILETPTVDSTSSPNKASADNNLDLVNRKPITSIVIAKKKPQLIENALFREDSDTECGKLTPLPLQQVEEVAPLSPKRRRSSPRRKRYNSPPSRWDASPKRRFRESPPRHRYSPSPRRSRNYRRSTSPRYRRSTSRERKGETIQQTLSRLAGVELYEQPAVKSSPVNSPLDGFRRSIADSTISDEQLLQNQQQFNPTDSPAYYPNNYPKLPSDGTVATASPKRIPLDDRINQVLGIEKEEPKPITTTYSQNNESYGGYSYGFGEEGAHCEYENKAFPAQAQFCDIKTPPPLVNKVLQVGNMLQVVPTEVPPLPPPAQTMLVTVHKEPENVQKILQVGNMLQIVPTPNPILPVVAPPSPVAPVVAVLKEKLASAEELMKQKATERREERERRRTERENRRKEKEKKQKEREKRKQAKIKLKTEEVIKRALQLDVEGANEDEEVPELKWWPATPAVISSTPKSAGKGILVVSRSELQLDEKPKKGVKFADGVMPGEGTSPSGGEELSSPPPDVVKLPKEKRFTKTKKPKKIKQPKKKKIKVKVVRQPKLSLDEDDDKMDNLPPPSPPPGSPPPHVYPPRVKAVAVAAPLNYQFNMGRQPEVQFNAPPPPIHFAPPRPLMGLTVQPPLMGIAVQPPLMGINVQPPPPFLQKPGPSHLIHRTGHFNASISPQQH